MFDNSDIIVMISDYLSYKDLFELSRVNRFLNKTILKNKHIMINQIVTVKTYEETQKLIYLFPNIKLAINMDIFNSLEKIKNNLYSVDLRFNNAVDGLLKIYFDKFIFKKVEEIDLSYTNIKHIDELADLENLRKLCLNGCKIIRNIPYFKYVKHIELNNTNIKDISNLWNIHTIYLENTNLKDISCLTETRILNVTNAGLYEIPYLPKIEILIADFNTITNYSNILHIKDISLRGNIIIPNIFKNAISANFSGCPYFIDVSELYNLSNLNLSYTSVKNVSKLSNVRYLNLHNCVYINDFSFKNTIMMNDTLILSKTVIKNTDLFVNVKNLDISATNITNIYNLSFGNFSLLDLSYCYSLRNIDCLLNTNIKKLDISKCFVENVLLNNTNILIMKFTKFRHIKLKNIEEADFSNTGINDKDMQNICLEKTKKINLTAAKISDVSMLENIENVNISYCKNIYNYQYLVNIPYLDTTGSNVNNIFKKTKKE